MRTLMLLLIGYSIGTTSIMFWNILLPEHSWTKLILSVICGMIAVRLLAQYGVLPI